MNRAGKFPTSLAGGDDILGRITELRSTIKFRPWGVPSMRCFAGGTLGLLQGLPPGVWSLWMGLGGAAGAMGGRQTATPPRAATGFVAERWSGLHHRNATNATLSIGAWWAHPRPAAEEGAVHGLLRGAHRDVGGGPQVCPRLMLLCAQEGGRVCLFHFAVPAKAVRAHAVPAPVLVRLAPPSCFAG